MHRRTKAFSIFTAAVLIFTMVFSSISLANVSSPLSDLGGHWAQNIIKSMVDEGIVGGYPDGTFKPDNSITRAEFATLLVKAFSLEPGSGKAFADTVEHWARDAIITANYHNLVKGYSDTAFGPDDLVTREQMAVMIVNALETKPSGESKSFTDNTQISAWAREPVAKASSAGLIAGYLDGTFKPKANATRAEAAVILSRGMEIMGKGTAATTFDTTGIYGPGGGVEAIDGNVVVTADGVTLQSLKITGDLTIAESVGAGTVILENVSVKGKTDVKGGGADSVIFRNCTLGGAVSVNKADGRIRIVAEGLTSVPRVVLQSGATLFSKDDGLFERVEIPASLPKDAEIFMTGSFGGVEIAAEDVKVKVGEGSKVDTLVLAETAAGATVDLDERAGVAKLTANAPVSITGQGQIANAEINASNVAIEQKPAKVDLKTGVRANVGGEVIGPAVPTGGGGGGGGGGTTTVAVTAVTVKGAGNATAIITSGGMLQMEAVISPASATDKSVTWSVDNETVAMIDGATGLLQALTNGTVKVTATAKDGSGVKGTATITVSGQEGSGTEPFVPGEGGSLPAFPVFEPQENTFTGLFIDRTERTNKAFSVGTETRVDLQFSAPNTYGAGSYTLQYSSDGEEWQNYQGSGKDLVTEWAEQNNFSISPDSDYYYRLLVNGGDKNGYTSNVVYAPVSNKVDTYFGGWFLDESMNISGTMLPWVGRGLEASFTVTNFESNEMVKVKYCLDDPEELEGIPDGDPEHLRFQWYRLNPATYEMTAIPDATELKYITTAADAGYKLVIRATGDGEHIGGFVQAMARDTMLPNKAFLSDIMTGAGFTLNLYRSVGSLSDLELELRDNENNLVPITAVSPVGNSNAVFAIKADISESNAPFRLTNNSIFWRIVSELGPGHMSEGIGFPARANLETIDENPQRFYACVYDLNKGYAPLEGLTAVEFSLEDESGNAVGFNFDDEELRNLEPEYAHEYLFSPKAGVFSGTYRLTFTKPGYQTVTITFSIEKVLNAVTITGEPEVGKQLVAALTPPEAQYGADYQWQRADAAEGEYVDIEENGEGYCYMLAAEDEGKFIRVIASGTGRYSESEPVISKPTVEIAPDTTAPVLSNPQAFEITDRSAILSFNSSEAGHFYYLVYREDPGKDFPNKEPEEVKSPDSTGGTADGGEGERGFAGGWTIRLGTVVELEAETVYKAYIVVEDAAGNISEVATIEFTTLPQPEEEEPGDVVDKNPLINAILQARQSYNNDEFLYTLESWEAFQAALTDAESVRDKGNATQSEIDEILEALEAAIEGLEKI